MKNVDIENIGKCLSLSLRDEIIPHWEFQILIGISVDEAKKIQNLWPDVDHKSEEVNLFVSGALVNLIGYPHGKEGMIYSETGLEIDGLKGLADRYHHSRKEYMCPICGYPDLDEPPYDDNGLALFEICPCCNNQFGYTDAVKNKEELPLEHKRLRELWKAEGYPWRGIKNRMPNNWDGEIQLKKACLP